MVPNGRMTCRPPRRTRAAVVPCARGPRGGDRGRRGALSVRLAVALLLACVVAAGALTVASSSGVLPDGGAALDLEAAVDDASLRSPGSSRGPSPGGPRRSWPRGSPGPLFPSPPEPEALPLPIPPLTGVDELPEPLPEPLPAPTTWQAERGHEAIAGIDYPWERLGWRIEFLAGRPGLLGLILPAERRIEIYVRRGQSLEHLRYVIAHEIGHAVDITYNDDARRARWLELRGLAPDTTWFGCARCPDYATGAGDYAEVFAWWQAGQLVFRSELAPAPSPDALSALEPLFHPRTRVSARSPTW